MNEAHHSHHRVNQAASYRTSIKLIIGFFFFLDDGDDNDDDSDCGSEGWEVTQRGRFGASPRVTGGRRLTSAEGGGDAARR